MTPTNPEKPMSNAAETPRTDAIWDDIPAGGGPVYSALAIQRLFQHARQLERELHAANLRAMQAEKDAERYRWLNNQHNFLIYIESEPEQRRNVRLRCGLPLDYWIDTAIDQALSTQDA